MDPTPPLNDVLERLAAHGVPLGNHTRSLVLDGDLVHLPECPVHCAVPPHPELPLSRLSTSRFAPCCVNTLYDLPEDILASTDGYLLRAASDALGAHRRTLAAPAPTDFDSALSVLAIGSYRLQALHRARTNVPPPFAPPGFKGFLDEVFDPSFAAALAAARELVLEKEDRLLSLVAAAARMPVSGVWVAASPVETWWSLHAELTTGDVLPRACATLYVPSFEHLLTVPLVVWTLWRSTVSDELWFLGSTASFSGGRRAAEVLRRLVADEGYVVTPAQLAAFAAAVPSLS